MSSDPSRPPATDPTLNGPDSEPDGDRHSNLVAIAGGVIALLCVIVPLTPGILFFLAPATRETLIEETPSGSNRGILVESSGAWIYAPHGIHVAQTGKWRKRKILNTSLANDGANLNPDNVQLFWQNETQAILRLDGQEQDPDCHLIILGQKPEARAIACPPAPS